MNQLQHKKQEFSFTINNQVTFLLHLPLQEQKADQAWENIIINNLIIINNNRIIINSCNKWHITL